MGLWVEVDATLYFDKDSKCSVVKALEEHFDEMIHGNYKQETIYDARVVDVIWTYDGGGLDAIKVLDDFIKNKLIGLQPSLSQIDVKFRMI